MDDQHATPDAVVGAIVFWKAALIISGNPKPADERSWANEALSLARELADRVDYHVMLDERRVELTDSGRERIAGLGERLGDIAKSVFQVYGVDAAGQVVIRRQLWRPYVLAFFQKNAALLGWHRGLCFIASLVARATGHWSHRAAHATGLREGLRQATEERCH